MCLHRPLQDRVLKTTAFKKASQLTRLTRRRTCSTENKTCLGLSLFFFLHRAVNKAVIIQHLSIRSVFVIVGRVLLVLNGADQSRAAQQRKETFTQAHWHAYTRAARTIVVLQHYKVLFLILCYPRGMLKFR